jgi:3-mercaptopyruvate sulfurtransferase SseA
MKLVPAKSIRFEKVEPEKLCNFIARKGEANVELTDVRTPQDFEGTAAEKFGLLKNAIKIPIQQLAQRLA